jgi:hypothetical protein
MYTLRIINQTQNGAEERRNTYLGNNYDVLLKTPVKEVVNSIERNRFNRAITEFYGIKDETEPVVVIDQTIIGFIYAETVHPIRDFEVAYIINQEGKTIERIYGMYQKA